MKSLCTILLFTWAATLNGDVVIYKFVETNVWTGAGVNIRQKVSGRLVFDVETSTAKLVTELAPNFTVDCPFFDAKYMDAPRIVDGRVRGRISQAAFFLKGDGYDADSGEHASNMQAFWRGNNSRVLISADEYLLIPKILKGSYQASYIGESGDTFVGTGNVVASYLGAATIAANGAGQTVDDVINSYIEVYHSRGWTEVAGDVPCE